MTESPLPVPHRTSRKASNGKTLNRKALWFSLHGWFALPIWGLLAFICITGTLSVLSEEITWLINKESRAYKTDATADINYPSILASIEARYPGAEINSIQFTQPYIASRVRISLTDSQAKALHVNQYTGQIQGEITGTGFRGFILALHGWLLFPWNDNYSVGWYLVTALSIPLLGSIISGLIIYKHFYRVILRPRLRLSMGARVFWGDLHRLIAAWSIWFVIIISVSGLWFLVQGVLDHNNIKIYPEKVRLHDAVTENKSSQKNIFIDRVIPQTKTLVPNLEITYIEFPQDASDTLMIQGKKPFSLLRGTANTLNFDPYNGSLIATKSASDLSSIQFMPVLLMPLHFGDFAGLISKLIWFFFGCLVSILVCSGFVIWSKRTFHVSKKIPNTNKKIDAETDKQHQRKKIKQLLFCISWLIVILPIYFFFQ
ncbi:MAG: PepSY-associated TM helix domain-containing protein [Cellvibrio sp.]